MPSAYTFIKELIFLGIKIGETATVRLDVDVQYRCSSCDADILTTGTVRAVAQTGAIMGVNLDSNLTGNAKKALVEKFDEKLGELLKLLKEDDLLIITARHADAIAERCSQLGIPAEKCLFLKNNTTLLDRFCVTHIFLPFFLE